jgi:hypothetical protein
MSTAWGSLARLLKEGDPYGRDIPPSVEAPTEEEPRSTWGRRREFPLSVIDERDVVAELEAVLRSSEPRMRRWLFNTWNANRQDLKFSELATAFDAGQFYLPDSTLRAWRTRYAEVVADEWAPQWRSVNERGASVMATAFPDIDSNPEYLFSLQNSLDDWVSQRSAEFIRDMMDVETRALNAVIQRHVVDVPMAPAELARLLRPLVGLTERQALGVSNYYDKLRADGVSETEARRLANQMAASRMASRANVIARTETASAYNFGTFYSMKGAIDSGDLGEDIVTKVWYTQLDERVCFPTFQPVDAPGGQRPIGDLKPDDVICATGGEAQEVTAASKKPWRGRLVCVFTSHGEFFAATDDHPVLANSEWKAAGDLVVDDVLDSREHERSEIIALLHLRIGDAGDAPSKSLQVLIADSTTGLVMPIGAVSLNTNASLHDGEVDVPVANRMLCDIRDPSIIQGRRHGEFETCRTSISGVALAGAKTSIGRRDLAKAFTTLVALDDTRHTPASLGAEMPVQVFLSAKALAAALAIDVDGVNGTASSAANGVAISIAACYAELFEAHRANLDKTRRLASASQRAELGLAVQREGLLAMRALVSELHASTWHDVVSLIGATEIDVVDITTETGTFYAGGLLVHNCPFCGPLHGQTIEMDGTFPGRTKLVPASFVPPAHPQCRCVVLYEIEDAD